MRRQKLNVGIHVVVPQLVDTTMSLKACPVRAVEVQPLPSAGVSCIPGFRLDPRLRIMCAHAEWYGKGGGPAAELPLHGHATTRASAVDRCRRALGGPREAERCPAVVAGAPRAVKVDFLRGTATCVRIVREKVV